MKAELSRQGRYYDADIFNDKGEYIASIKLQAIKSEARKAVNEFNAALDRHVQSALSAKVDEIKAEFDDVNCKQLMYKYKESIAFFKGLQYMRDEILKRLTK